MTHTPAHAFRTATFALRCCRAAGARLSGVLLALAAANALAVPTVLDGSVTLTTFDQGGVLDFATAGGHLGAIEVTAAGEVFVIIDTPSLGELTSSLRLVRSSGPQTAQFVGPAQPITLMPWASDLTLGPGGLLYVAGAMNNVGGIFGFDPDGVAAPQAFASGTCSFSTSGLTFAADGSHALVSTDGSQTDCANGLFRVWPDGSSDHLITQLDVPDGIPRGTDDHTVMLDGRVILAGDKSRDLWDVTQGPGGVAVAIDLDRIFTIVDIPSWNGADRVFGSRIAVDPVSGDLFYSHSAGNPDKQMTILRISADFATASIFAEGFSILRDLDFGPAGSDNSRSLFVVEQQRAALIPGSGDSGVIYEIAFPADADADGIPDVADNCTTAINPDQRDSNGDGYGNLCDGDLNGDCAVNAVDLGLFRSAFFGADEDADLNGDGIVNPIDLGILKTLFLLPPGPAAAGGCP